MLAKETTASAARQSAPTHTFVPFTAQTRMSGVDLDGRQIRKGAADVGHALVTAAGRVDPRRLDGRRRAHLARAARRSSSPTDAQVLGVIHLKDIVKEGMRERFDRAARRWASAR